MSSARLVSVIHRSIPPSTVAHVFGLVQSYLAHEAPLGSKVIVASQRLGSTRSKAPYPSLARTLSRAASLKPQCKRYASVAHAYKEPEIDAQESYYYPDHPPHLPWPPDRPQPPPETPSIPRDEPSPDSPGTDAVPPSTSTTPEPTPSLSDPGSQVSALHTPRYPGHIPFSVSSYLPRRIRDKLVAGKYKSATTFRRAFERATCGPRHLTQAGNLMRVFDLVFRDGDEDGYRWLLGMIPEISKTADDAATVSLAQTLEAFTLVRLGEETGRSKLEMADRGLRDSAQKDIANSAVKGKPMTKDWAIVGCGWAILGEYGLARSRMIFALEAIGTLPRRFTGRIMAAELGYFQAYRDALPPRRRVEDLIHIFESSPGRTVFFSDKHEQHNFALLEIWLEAFARIPRPVEWAETRLSGQRTPSTEGAVAMLYLASLRTSREEETTQLRSLLVANQIAIPADPVKVIRPSLRQFERAQRAAAGEAVVDPTVEPADPTSTRAPWAQRVETDHRDPHAKEIVAGSHHDLSRKLEAFVKAGMLSQAEDTQSEIVSRFIPTHEDNEAVARIHAGSGKVTETKAALNDAYGPFLPGSAMSILIRAHCNANDPSGAEEFLNPTTSGMEQINMILKLYADRGELAPAVNLFDRAVEWGKKPTIKSYMALIRLFAKRLDIHTVERLLETMREQGVEPDAILWSMVLSAYVERGEWVTASQRYESLPREIRLDPVVLAAILRAFVYIAAPTDVVLSLFRQIPHANTKQWALAIQSACDDTDVGLAMNLFAEMDAKGDPKPDVVTHSMLLHLYLRLNDGEKAREVYDEMLKRDLIPTSVTYAMIIQSFTAVRSQESLEQAHNFAMSIRRLGQLEQLPEIGAERGRVSENLFAPLINASGRVRQPDAAKAYFDLATSDQAPTVPLWTALLDAHRRSGDLPKVLETWKLLFKQACDETEGGDGSIRLSSNFLCMPLSITLDAISSQGRPNSEVRDLWISVRDAGFGFDAGNYNHYAVALARTGDVESAFHVIERVVIPRWDEVRQRRSRALREGSYLSPREPGESFDDGGEAEADPIDIADTPVDTPNSGAVRRAHFRYDMPYDSQRNDREDLIPRLLERWRPSDTLWRPSLLTIAVLDQAYADLEEAKQRSRIALMDTEEERGREKTIRLESFGGVSVRDPNGESTKSAPTTIVARLNKRYARTVGLILLHRKKGKTREFKERSGTRDVEQRERRGFGMT